VKEYYDRRAPEYDDWWHGAERDRAGWREELAEVIAVLRALPQTRTLDVACGTGYITQHLSGDVVGLDQSARMLEEARRRLPRTTFVRGEALELPFPNGAFGRIFASYFYCHLEEEDARRFVTEARRVGDELVVMASRWDGVAPKNRWEQRPLSEGTTWPVYKRVFDPDELAAELGGEVLHAGPWFVVVRAAL
jgi:ubiquinone/menaquinone biosynthesis C-methylase UbiE